MAKKSNLYGFYAILVGLEGDCVGEREVVDVC